MMIRVHELTKTFGEVTAVAGVTFDVKSGEIFAFLGPNGAGKTTTIQMLTTLLRPTSGSIAIDGLDPAAQPLETCTGCSTTSPGGSAPSASKRCSPCSSCGTGATIE
jgi:ABC-type multidrug transport system ATPase subunit